MGLEHVGVGVAAQKSRRGGALAKASGAGEDVLEAEVGGAEVEWEKVVVARAEVCRGKEVGSPRVKAGVSLLGEQEERGKDARGDRRLRASGF